MKKGKEAASTRYKYLSSYFTILSWASAGDRFSGPFLRTHSSYPFRTHSFDPYHAHCSKSLSKAEWNDCIVTCARMLVTSISRTCQEGFPEPPETQSSVPLKVQCPDQRRGKFYSEIHKESPKSLRYRIAMVGVTNWPMAKFGVWMGWGSEFPFLPFNSHKNVTCMKSKGIWSCEGGGGLEMTKLWKDEGILWLCNSSKDRVSQWLFPHKDAERT